VVKPSSLTDLIMSSFISSSSNVFIFFLSKAMTEKANLIRHYFLITLDSVV